MALWYTLDIVDFPLYTTVYFSKLLWNYSITIIVVLSLFSTQMKTYWYTFTFSGTPSRLLYSALQVYICSNSMEARQQVIELARQLSFIPVDMGMLSLAKEIENMPLRLFSDWKGPVLTAIALSIFFFAYSFIRDIIHPYVKNRQSFFYKIPLEMVNRTLPVVAITLLALVYLAGQLAAAYQLFYGTKFRRFPCWLQGWLQSRKQLGLLSFFYACIHVLYSLCLPMRRSERYLLLNMAYQQVCHC